MTKFVHDLVCNDVMMHLLLDDAVSHAENTVASDIIRYSEQRDICTIDINTTVSTEMDTMILIPKT